MPVSYYGGVPYQNNITEQIPSPESETNDPGKNAMLVLRSQAQAPGIRHIDK